jgi:hypothetical protein
MLLSPHTFRQKVRWCFIHSDTSGLCSHNWQCCASMAHVSVTHSDPPSRVAPSFLLERRCSLSPYYGGSVTMRLSTFRRSRFCAYETCSVFRCPFVPYRVHYPPYIEESVRLSRSWQPVYPRKALGCFRCRSFRHGLTDAAYRHAGTWV